MGVCILPGVNFTSIRPVYIYGPLNYNPVEEYFFHRIKAGRPIVVPGSGMQVGLTARSMYGFWVDQSHVNTFYNIIVCATWGWRLFYHAKVFLRSDNS